MGDSRAEMRNLKANKCHDERGNQLFILTDDGEIREKKFCLDATEPGSPVKIIDCHGYGGNQYWVYDESVRDSAQFSAFFFSSSYIV